MQLVIEELESKLSQRTLSKCYLLLSTEPFLLQEARSRIWKHVSTQGFTDRQVWEISSQSNWDQIKKHNSFLDVFGKQLLDLRITEFLKAEAGKQLQTLVQQLTAQPSAPLLMISYTQSIKKAQLHNWFQKIASIGTLVILPVPFKTELPHWINKQFSRSGLRLSRQGLSLLLQYTEGNMQAIIQILRKLVLIYAPNVPALEPTQLQPLLEDQSTFELFHLTEAILQGKTNRCLRIIQRLRMTSVSQALVLGYLLKLLRTAVRLHHGLTKGEDLNELFRQHLIWKNQQVTFKQLAERIRTNDIPSLFNLAHHIDQCIKGVVLEDAWHGLQQLSLYLAEEHLSLPLRYDDINQ